jgi:hypothetical protein
MAPWEIFAPLGFRFFTTRPSYDKLSHHSEVRTVSVSSG